MNIGDVAGLALLNLPYTWIGIVKSEDLTEIWCYDQQTGKTEKQKTKLKQIWLRAHCNFDTDTSQFSYSPDGINFYNLGEKSVMVYQLRTFQGVRYALFNYSTTGKEGGYADFNSFKLQEPRPNGLTKPVPYNQVITLTNLGDNTVLVNWRNFLRPVPASDRLTGGNMSHFRVLDRGKGRIALQSVADSGFVTVKGLGGMAEVRIEKEDQGEASTFQWQDMLRGDLMLMSLKTHRYLFVDPNARSLCSADAPGTRPDRKDGACFVWKKVTEGNK
jgi:hypothetical protein